MNRKLSEALAFSAPDVWVPVELYRQMSAVGTVAITSPPTEVTVQLRKATDASGSNPADLGTAVTAESQAVAEANAVDLGETAGGVAYTHVSATITGAGSPPAASAGLLIRGDGRFNP